MIYTCKGKGGAYELLGMSIGAGTSRGVDLVVYQDAAIGQLFHRAQEDWAVRMHEIPFSGGAQRTVAELKADARRYQGWRDAMLNEDAEFVAVIQQVLPPTVGTDRTPTAAEWDAAIDATLNRLSKDPT